MSDNSNSNGGLSLGVVLGIVFIILKLTKVIDWSWWWVTIPLWGGVAVAYVGVVFAFLVALVTRK